MVGVWRTGKPSPGPNSIEAIDLAAIKSDGVAHAGQDSPLVDSPSIVKLLALIRSATAAIARSRAVQLFPLRL